MAGGPAGFPRFRGCRRFDSLSRVSGVRVEGEWLRIASVGRMAVRRRGGAPYPDEGQVVSVVLKRERGKRHAVVCSHVTAPLLHTGRRYRGRVAPLRGSVRRTDQDQISQHKELSHELDMRNNIKFHI